MTTEDAKEIVTGKLPGCNRIEIRRAWQTLVNSGDIWSMPAKYGTIASYLIEAGVVERNAP